LADADEVDALLLDIEDVAGGDATAVLPPLTGSKLAAFANDEYSVAPLEPGTLFYRAEFASAPGPTEWLGLEPVDSVAEAQEVYNVNPYNLGQQKEVLRTYRLTKKVTGYYGKVAGGGGYQFLLPQGVDPNEVLQWVSTKTLS